MSKGVIVLPPTAPTAPTAMDTAAASAKDKAKDEAKEEGGEGGGGDGEPSPVTPPAAPPAASGADSSAWWERPWMIAAFRYGKATAAKGGGGNGGNGGKGGKGGGGKGDSGPPGVITALFDDAISMASFEGSWSQGGSCGPWSLVRDCYLSFVLHRDMTMVSGDCIHS